MILFRDLFKLLCLVKMNRKMHGTSKIKQALFICFRIDARKRCYLIRVSPCLSKCCGECALHQLFGGAALASDANEKILRTKADERLLHSDRFFSNDSACVKRIGIQSV